MRKQSPLPSSNTLQNSRVFSGGASEFKLPTQTMTTTNVKSVHGRGRQRVDSQNQNVYDNLLDFGIATNSSFEGNLSIEDPNIAALLEDEPKPPILP
jgi:hypothetical protein